VAVSDTEMGKISSYDECLGPILWDLKTASRVKFADRQQQFWHTPTANILSIMGLILVYHQHIQSHFFVCLSVCNAVNFWKLGPRRFIFLFTDLYIF